ncbi:OPN5 protein, partial [Eudromia elegans]|nr:OPN5 protein [Eudromia elegans]
RWLFDRAVCTVYAFCGVLFGLCSLSSLTALSTVCCLKVCYPAYGRCCTPVPALCSGPSPFTSPSSLSWESWSPGRLFLWGSYGPEPYGTACCITWNAASREAALYILALFVFCYLLPCLLIVASYALILWTVKGSRRAVRQH